MACSRVSPKSWSRQARRRQPAAARPYGRQQNPRLTDDGAFTREAPAEPYLIPIVRRTSASGEPCRDATDSPPGDCASAGVLAPRQGGARQSRSRQSAEPSDLRIEVGGWRGILLLPSTAGAWNDLGFPQVGEVPAPRRGARAGDVLHGRPNMALPHILIIVRRRFHRRPRPIMEFRVRFIAGRAIAAALRNYLKRSHDPVKKERFRDNQLVFYGVMRALEIISEAPRRLPAAMKARRPEIP